MSEAGQRQDVVVRGLFAIPYRKSSLDALQGELIALHAFPAALHEA